MTHDEYVELCKKRKRLWTAMRMVEPGSMEAYKIVGMLINEPLLKYPKNSEVSDGRA